MKMLLELFRIILIIVFVGGMIGTGLNYFYQALGINMDHFEWVSFVAVLLLLFVVYRNKWQFTGWYNGQGNKRLPPKITIALLICSILLLVVFPIVRYLFNSNSE